MPYQTILRRLSVLSLALGLTLPVTFMTGCAGIQIGVERNKKEGTKASVLLGGDGGTLEVKGVRDLNGDWGTSIKYNLEFIDLEGDVNCEGEVNEFMDALTDLPLDTILIADLEKSDNGCLDVTVTVPTKGGDSFGTADSVEKSTFDMLCCPVDERTR